MICAQYCVVILAVLLSSHRFALQFHDRGAPCRSTAFTNALAYRPCSTLYSYVCRAVNNEGERVQPSDCGEAQVRNNARRLAGCLCGCCVVFAISHRRRVFVLARAACLSFGADDPSSKQRRANRLRHRPSILRRHMQSLKRRPCSCGLTLQQQKQALQSLKMLSARVTQRCWSWWPRSSCAMAK